jgi:type II secretory pathway component PulM
MPNNEAQELTDAFAKAAPTFQRIADTITRSFRDAALDTELVAKLRELGARLKAIRDRERR